MQKTIEKDFISLKELSKKLSISEATAKNWVKLKKISPQYSYKNIPYFSEKYVESLIKELNSKSSNKLKSRRNKKYISGSFFYKDYITQNSKNLNLVENLLDYIKTNEIILSEDEIKYIIADCAIQLFIQCKKLSTKIKKKFLSEYLNNNLAFGAWDKFIDELIENKKYALGFINNNNEIFEINYIYEKNEDILGLLYISLSNLGNRKALGAYYTPTEIVKKIVPDLKSGKKILDPCCGSGNFLLQLPDNLDIEQIYGNDINQTAIKITRLNMLLKYKIKNPDILYKNFTNKDFLLNNCLQKFDYIIGNPPWGAEFSQNTKTQLKERYLSAKGENIESYDVFIEKSLSKLNKNGNLSFVLPEAILTVKNHRKIREIILKNTSFKKLEYLGNIFNKVQCPSIILQLQNTSPKGSSIGMEIKYKNKNYIINNERDLSPEAFSFSMDNKEYKIFSKILNLKNIKYLKNNAIFALGIVTGDNQKYLSKTKTSQNEIIIKGSDIDKFRIKNPKYYIKYTPEKYQQVAPTEYYRAKEKLLYKFISKKLVFAYDNAQTLTLNSCNILIPQIRDFNIKYIMAILNSRISQFLFEKKYNSVKVLRSHIESIPIPVCSNKQHQEIIDIIDKILNTKDNKTSELYEILENKISQIYKLNKTEYNIIKNSLLHG